MPGGNRETHDFPHGKPLLLTVIDIGFMLLLVVSWVAFDGFKSWRSPVTTLAVLAAYAYTRSIALRRYELAGQAVARRRIYVTVRFPGGLPTALLAARCAFFVVVALMLMFGVGPFGFDVARHAIIGCVFGLVAVAIVNLSLERHYVKIGRAIEVESAKQGL